MRSIERLAFQVSLIIFLAALLVAALGIAALLGIF